MPSDELTRKVATILAMTAEPLDPYERAAALIVAVDAILDTRLASLGGHLLNAGKAEHDLDAGTPAGLARAQARASIGAALLDHYTPKVAQ